MKRTQALHDAGQSIWLDNVTRTLLDRGILDRYIARYSVTGLTSNPTILDNAIKEGTDYDADIAARKATGASDEEVVFELALADLRRAADKFAPIYARTDGVDGWVSLEVSPLLAHNAQSTIEEATALCRKGARGNLFIKIPGTAESLPAIEECIYSRVPVNVTLLFSAEQYEAAAEAYLRGVERRIQAGKNPAVASVASLFVSRWDKAVAGRVPEELRDRLGIAVAKQAYRAYRELLDSPRWGRLANEGARPQRLLWASTSVKDPKAPDVLYVNALAAPLTVNTMPEHTLEAFADHGEVGELLPADGGDADEVIAAFAKADIDTESLADELQQDGAEAFVASWKDLLARVGSRHEQLPGCADGQASHLPPATATDERGVSDDSDRPRRGPGGDGPPLRRRFDQPRRGHGIRPTRSTMCSASIRGTPTRPVSPRARLPKHTWRCGWRSTTGAGPTYPSSSGPARRCQFMSPRCGCSCTAPPGILPPPAGPGRPQPDRPAYRP